MGETAAEDEVDEVAGEAIRRRGDGESTSERRCEVRRGLLNGGSGGGASSVHSVRQRVRASRTGPGREAAGNQRNEMIVAVRSSRKCDR